MPAKSKQQQKFMGIVRAIQKGEVPAIIYGGKEENHKISLSKKQVKYLFDQENFLTSFPKSFTPFQNVQVKDVVVFQNSNTENPIWLKVVAKNKEHAIVRYNLGGIRLGKKDHYF